VKYITKEQADLKHGDNYSKLVFAENINMYSDKSLVQMIIIEPKTDVASHYHEKTTEIFYFLSGVGTFIVDGKSIICEPGSILICEPGEKHPVKNDSDEPWKYLAFKTYQEGGDSIWD